MKIHIIRHGETTSDIEDRYGGSYDDHLTPKGREQLEETAKKLFDKKIEIIFTSPLIRAKESAEIIQNSIKSEIEIVDDIRERHYGILTGLTKDEALEKYPDVVEAHKNPENTDPEGESLDEFKNRVIQAFKSILNKEHKKIAIVAHGGPIKQILRYLNENIPDKIGDGEIIELNT